MASVIDLIYELDTNNIKVCYICVHLCVRVVVCVCIFVCVYAYECKAQLLNNYLSMSKKRHLIYQLYSIPTNRFFFSYIKLGNLFFSRLLLESIY